MGTVKLKPTIRITSARRLKKLWINCMQALKVRVKDLALVLEIFSET